MDRRSVRLGKPWRPREPLAKTNPGSNRPFSWMQGVFAFAIIASLFFWLQFSTPDICCGDFDGYYHIHWSGLLGNGISHGHLPSFSWLPLTSLNAHDYADQHLLFHLLLIPFTWFATPVLAAKITAALRQHRCFLLLLDHSALPPPLRGLLAPAAVRLFFPLSLPHEHDPCPEPLGHLHHGGRISVV